MEDKIYQLLEPRQWQKLYNFIDDYFLNRPAAALAAVLLLVMVVLLICSFRSKEASKTVIRRAAFWDYVIIILLLSVLNREGGTRVLRLTFDPWAAGESGWHESNILISLADAAYFLPFGALARWQFSGKMRLLKAFLMVAVAGFLVELIQYVFARGVASAGDLAAYMVGGSLGILLASIAGRISLTSKKFKRKSKN